MALLTLSRQLVFILLPLSLASLFLNVSPLHWLLGSSGLAFRFVSGGRSGAPGEHPVCELDLDLSFPPCPLTPTHPMPTFFSKFMVYIVD